MRATVAPILLLLNETIIVQLRTSKNDKEINGLFALHYF
jgi:hypothetical protein